jgi:hypothetical protein
MEDRDDQLETAPASEEPEGLDTDATTGWDDYPLDSVFVRTQLRTIGEVVGRIRQNRYDLNPEFQRAFVWSPEKQSRLIESCLMRIPLPVFYVAEAPDGRIIVVDGLQRLTTFRRYLDGQFALTFPKRDDARPNPLSGKEFKDLELKLRERIEDTQLTLYVLDEKAPIRAKFDIFERVNSGEPLTRQQMRNCLYNGKATTWLKTAADSKAFLRATGESLNRKEMRDREAINRFCAFRLLGWREYPDGNMDAFLAEALGLMNRYSEEQLDQLRAAFERSMSNNFALFGNHAFRKSLASQAVRRSALNIAFFDVCSVLLADLSEADVSAAGTGLVRSIRTLIHDERFEPAITYATNSRKRVQTRFELLEQAVRGALP